MTINGYVEELVSYLFFLPASIFCFLPMRNQLRFKPHVIIRRTVLFFLTVLPIAAFLPCCFSFDSNILTLPILALSLFAYHHCLKTHISQSLSIFLLACSLMGFIGNIGNVFDALLFPAPAPFSMQASLFEFFVSLFLMLLLLFPMYRYGSRLIDQLSIYSIWYMTLPVSGAFLALNVAVIPHEKSTLYTNHVLPAFLVMLGIMFFLLLLICIMFYKVSMGILKAAEAEQRICLLELLENQYEQLHEYMENTERVRHDFRHTLNTLKILSDQNNYSELNQYLLHYIEAVPITNIISYCKNNPLNALLNFYGQSATEAKILLKWKLDLPSALAVSDTDLCGIIGNILENAIRACRSVPEEKRFIQLTVTARHNTWLYILATNSFDGNVRQQNGQYHSTRKNGTGLGLKSITATVQKYGGTAQFSHDTEFFYTDIMLPLHPSS